MPRRSCGLGERLRPDERFFTVFDPVIASLAESSRNAWITGRLATAEHLAARAVAVGQDVGNHDSLAFAWLFHAWVHGYKGDWRTCVASAAAGMAVADAVGAPQTLAWNRCVHGWARAHLGNPHDGARELEDGVRLSQSISGEVAMPQFRAMMVEVLRLGGQEDAAGRWVVEALEAGVDHDDDYFSAEIHRLAAACAPTTNGATARGHLERALSIADAQGAGFFHVRAALDLHALTGDLRRVRDALQHVAEPLDYWPDIAAARRCVQGAAPGKVRPSSGSARAATPATGASAEPDGA